MSGQFSSAVIFISVVAIAVAANLADESSPSARRNQLALRGPASISKKDMIFGELKPTMELKHTEKVHGGIYVKIALTGAKPHHAGDVFVMRGEIRSEDGDLTGVDFKWSLPAGVRLVNGQLNGTLSSLAADHPAIVELTLEKTSANNEQIHLLAGASRGSSRMADSAQFNTDVQDQLEAGRAAIKSGLEAQGQKHSDIKVFH